LQNKIIACILIQKRRNPFLPHEIIHDKIFYAVNPSELIKKVLCFNNYSNTQYIANFWIWKTRARKSPHRNPMDKKK
jgi:hypothetical protein